MSRALWAVWMIVLLAACDGGSTGFSGGGPTALEADQVLFGMRHYITSNGIRQALLTADTALFFSESEPIEFRGGVELKIYATGGEVAATLTAAKAFLEPRTQVMQAKGDVVLITPEGDQRLETEELHYDHSIDKIWSDTPTTLIRDGRATHGDGFTSDGQGRNVKVIRPHGQIQLPEGEVSGGRI